MKRSALWIAVVLAVSGASGPVDAATVYEEFTIPMDDGVRLYGWVAYEEPLQPRPVVLIEAIYGNRLPGSRGLSFAVGSDLPTGLFPLEDFAIALVHMRGIGASEGSFDLFGRRTKQDAWSIIDFLTKQPWSDGRIATTGGSGNGIANFDLATSGHPGLKAVVALTTPFDFYRDFWQGGGAGNARLGIAFAGVLPTSLTDPANIEARQRVGVPTEIIPEQIAALEQTMSQSLTRWLDGPWWRERSNWEEAPGYDVPILIGSSFYDLVSWNQGTAAFRRFPNSWLLMGWGHDGPTRIQNEHSTAFIRRFVGHFALGEQNGFENEPRVLLPLNLGSRMAYANGNILMQTAQSWPLEGTDWTRMYLRDGRTGSAVSLNDGALSLEPPSSDEGPDMLPVAPLMGPHFELHVPFGLGLSRLGDATWSTPLQSAAEAAGDAIIDMRPDEGAALTYTTPPFSQNVEIAGPVTMTVWARSTAPDFLWVLRVTDVWPDGRSIWLGDLVLRASMRRLDLEQTLRNDDGDIVIPHQTFDAYQPVQPTDVLEYVIDAGSFANVFVAGHRLRLDVIGVGSATPDAPITPGVVEVFHDSEHPSSVMLPVIPAGCNDAAIAFPEVVHPGPCATTLEEAIG